jgi:phosphoglycerol transferase MdoB-like AlkP superfamily enzyme
MGFDEVVGSEDVADDLKTHVYGWGLEDRMLYEQLVTFLDARRNEKLFVAVLGTDTHPLTGRTHRSPGSYPATPTDFESRFGKAADLMQSVFRADHDLARLVGMMRARDLLGPDTLLLITADHACSPNPVTRYVPGHSRSPLGRIPLVILSGGKLPHMRRDVMSSQLDIAPTILHLLDLPIPETWWGESMFAPRKVNQAIGFDRQNLIIRGPERLLVVPINRQGRAEHGDLINLFSGRAELP